MVWFLYNLVFPIIFLFMLPRFLARMWKRGGYQNGFLQRFAVYDKTLLAKLGRRSRIWIHAVSVGEAGVALRFMLELRKSLPDAAFVVTTTTSTAHAILNRELSGEDVLLYFPVDLPWIMRRALASIRPRALVLVESELWPNLVRLAHARHVPLMLLNGRISSRSFGRYCMARKLVRDILRRFDLVCAQSGADAERLTALGAPANRVFAVGSAKFDVAGSAPTTDGRHLRALLANAGFAVNAPLLVGGSTWPGEEAVLLQIYARLRLTAPESRLILVPRHAERRQAVLDEIQNHGLNAVLWSKLKTGQTVAAADVVLVDTTGELVAFYAAANIVFVGKSLMAHGGQNVIEAAALAKPIIVGPNMENFASVMADFLAAQALIQVNDSAALEKAVLTLWSDQDKQRNYGSRALEVTLRKAGAICASAEHFRQILGAQKANE